MERMTKTVDIENFKGVPSTLFLVIWAQYLESKSPNGIVKNPKIIEIVESLNYDFSKYRVTSDERLGVVIRKQLIEREVQKFILQNPGGIVVNLGCGLDTHYERFKHTDTTWYDLDLPPVIALRSLFFPETDRHKLICKSVMDLSWTQGIPKDKKILILAEGLLPYFLESEVKTLLTHIDEQFPKSELLLHALSPWRIKLIHRDLKKAALKLGWGITHGKNIEDWLQNLRFQNEWYIFAQYPSRWSWYMRLLNLFPLMIKQEKIIHLVHTE
jgi:O-methyltransferase involved in polyketide biosynthesis